MHTILRSRTNEVVIDTEGPVVIIGESINPTRRKKLVETLSQYNFDFAIQLGKSQVDAGADVLDVNVGYPGVDDVALLPATVRAIQQEVDVPLCLDSPNPAAIEAALKVIEGKALINSVNGEEKSLEAVLPIAKEYGAAVIGLVMDDEGVAVKGLLVRHLVMPGSLGETGEILRFLAQKISVDTYVNVMDQYRPCGKAYQCPPIDRRLTHDEYQEALKMAKDAGLQRLDEKDWLRIMKRLLIKK